MALVTVKFFATFREASGEREAQADAGDLQELLETLSTRYGSRMGALLCGRLGDTYVVLVNGRSAAQQGGTLSRLEDGDEVALFPPVSGG